MRKEDKRRLFWGAVTVLMVVLVLYYGPAVVFFYATKRTIRNEPASRVVPQPLLDTAVAPAAGPEFSYFGVQFRAAWDGQTEIKEVRSLVRIQFPTGQSVLFFDPSAGLDMVETARQAHQPDFIENLYGAEAARSNYSLMEAALNSIPDQLSLWQTRRGIATKGQLLILKTIIIRHGETGLYRFQMGNLKGFQEGDPGKANVVVVHGFDKSDRQYEIEVGAPRAGLIKQSEINTILSSLQITKDPRKYN